MHKSTWFACMLELSTNLQLTKLHANYRLYCNYNYTCKLNCMQIPSLYSKLHC